MQTQTAFQAAIAGRSPSLITVHAVEDLERDQARFFMTRGPVDRMRVHHRVRAFRFHVALAVPADSTAASEAYLAWVSAA